MSTDPKAQAVRRHRTALTDAATGTYYCSQGTHYTRGPYIERVHAHRGKRRICMACVKRARKK